MESLAWAWLEPKTVICGTRFSYYSSTPLPRAELVRGCPSKPLVKYIFLSVVTQKKSIWRLPIGDQRDPFPLKILPFPVSKWERTVTISEQLWVLRCSRVRQIRKSSGMGVVYEFWCLSPDWRPLKLLQMIKIRKETVWLVEALVAYLSRRGFAESASERKSCVAGTRRFCYIDGS